MTLVFILALHYCLKWGYFIDSCGVNWFKLIWINPPQQEYEKKCKIQHVGVWKFSFTIDERIMLV